MSMIYEFIWTLIKALNKLSTRVSLKILTLFLDKQGT